MEQNGTAHYTSKYKNRSFIIIIISLMYECKIKAWGESLDCRDKAQCLEVMVSVLIMKTNVIC